MRDFLFFDKMLIPQVITFIYWVHLVGAVLGGISVMFLIDTFSIKTVFLGLLSILGGFFISRIICELLIVLFKIHEILQGIKNHASLPVLKE